MNEVEQRNSREVAREMRDNLKDPGVAPAPDTIDRALWRVETTLLGFYDEPDDEEDPGMAVRDLLTDLVHYCEVHDIDIEQELEGAQNMAAQEIHEWDERYRQMFRRESPSVESRAGSGEY